MTNIAPRITLKNLKVNEALSDETTCYSATVYLDGKPVLLASNHGHGGEDMYARHAKATPEQEAEAFAVAEAIVRQNPPEWINSMDRTEFMSSVIIDLLDAAETEAQYRRWCKKSVVFHVEGEHPDQFRTLTAKYDPTRAAAIRASIEKRYPGKAITIVNERYA